MVLVVVSISARMMRKTIRMQKYIIFGRHAEESGKIIRFFLTSLDFSLTLHTLRENQYFPTPISERQQDSTNIS
jgi:hypothetical protein